MAVTRNEERSLLLDLAQIQRSDSESRHTAYMAFAVLAAALAVGFVFGLLIGLLVR